jgi:hypothetical protein
MHISLTSSGKFFQFHQLSKWLSKVTLEIITESVSSLYSVESISRIPKMFDKFLLVSARIGVTPSDSNYFFAVQPGKVNLLIVSQEAPMTMVFFFQTQAMQLEKHATSVKRK